MTALRPQKSVTRKDVSREQTEEHVKSCRPKLVTIDSLSCEHSFRATSEDRTSPVPSEASRRKSTATQQDQRQHDASIMPMLIGAAQHQNRAQSD